MFKGTKQWAKRGLKIRFGENNDASEGDLGRSRDGEVVGARRREEGAGSLCRDGCKPPSQASWNTLTVLDVDNFRLVKGRYREISPTARKKIMPFADSTYRWCR